MRDYRGEFMFEEKSGDLVDKIHVLYKTVNFCLLSTRVYRFDRREFLVAQRSNCIQNHLKHISETMGQTSQVMV